MDRRSALLAGLILSFAVAPVSAQEEPAFLDLRLQRVPSEDLIQLIARVAEPETLTLADDESFLSFVERRCGLVHPAWVRLFLDANPDLTESDLYSLSGRQVTVPACARAPAPVAVEVEAGDRLERLFTARGERFASAQFGEISAELGEQARLARLTDSLASRTSDAGYLAMENVAAFALINPSVDPNTLQPGETLLLPQGAMWSSVPLRNGIDAHDLERVRREVGGAAGPSLAATLFHDVIAETGRCEIDLENWPYDPATLRAALSRNAQLRPLGTFVTVSEVLILDTGVDEQFITGVVSDRLQGRLRPYAAVSGGARYLGVNLALGSQDATPPPALPNRAHGGEVASVLLGARWVSDNEALLDPYIDVAFASVAQPGDPPFLSARAIANVVSEADRNEVDVVNVSLSASEERGTFVTAAAAYNMGLNLLFVAAAGNDGRVIGQGNFEWLGSWGGAPTGGPLTTIITVGGHDQDGQLLAFSRRSETRVDILAPACAIPVLSGIWRDDGYHIESLHRSGTSYAAPQVSLIAALLRAEELAPQAVKMRIVQAADYDPALEGLAWSAGRLNIERALSVFEDHLTWRRNGQVVVTRGRLLNPAARIRLCGRSVRLSEVGKLAQGGPAGAGRVLLWIAGADSQEPWNMERVLCDSPALAPEVLLFEDAESGAEIEVPISNIIDFTARTLQGR